MLDKGAAVASQADAPPRACRAVWNKGWAARLRGLQEVVAGLARVCQPRLPPPLALRSHCGAHVVHAPLERVLHCCGATPSATTAGSSYLAWVHSQA